MDNKTSLTPELKQIYDRVMNSAEENAKTPENVKQENAEPQMTEPPKPAVEINTPPVVENPQPPTPTPQAQEVKPAEAVAAGATAMSGTVTTEKPKKSRKALFIVLSLVFVIAWAVFWAFIFGFLKI